MILITLIIGNFLSLFITFWTSTQKLADNRSNWFNIVTRKGWMFWIISIIFLLVTITQYYLIDYSTQEDQDKRDAAMAARHDASMRNLKLSYDTSTAAIQSKADSNSLRITKALAEYNLQYNNRQNKIEVLVSDAGTEAPVLSMGTDVFPKIKLSPDKTYYEYGFVTRRASASAINLTLSVVVRPNEEVIQYAGSQEVFKNKTFIKEEGLSGRFYRDSANHYPFSIVWFRGTYKNANGTRTYKFDETVLLNHNTNTSNELGGTGREKAIELVNIAEKKKRK